MVRYRYFPMKVLFRTNTYLWHFRIDLRPSSPAITLAADAGVSAPPPITL
jgi:hypothetical protein